ncbi:putative PHD type zinc finger protein with BAH domain-containing protein, partial [Borealophlyctis nickersoniae]
MALKALLDEYLDEIKNDLPLNLKSVDVIDRALQELHKAKYDRGAAVTAMLKLTPADLGVVEWTDDETKAFEGAVAKYGHELHWVHKEVPTKSINEIVSYFYKWKKTRRYVAAVYSQFAKNTVQGM